MSRMTNKPGLPDLDVVHEVIRLDDLLVAASRRWGPGGSLRGSWLPERTALFEYLAGLPDVRMAELHALFWLGNRPSSTARAYDPLYQHAMNNLDHGASYLTGRPLGSHLRRGLAKLGLPTELTSSRPMNNPGAAAQPEH
jgi:Protein of unknown function (DUF3775)